VKPKDSLAFDRLHGRAQLNALGLGLKESQTAGKTMISSAGSAGSGSNRGRDSCKGVQKGSHQGLVAPGEQGRITPAAQFTDKGGAGCWYDFCGRSH
jgi:hypothetical protein